MMLSAVTTSAQQSDMAQQFEQELKTKNGDVTSIKCRFTQTREVSVLASAVVKGGQFYFQQGGNMLLRFEDGDYIKMTSEWFEMCTAGNTTKTKVASNPMLKNLSAILSACVVGDFEQIARGYSYAVEQSAKEWIVTLTPQRGKGAKIAKIAIHFDRANMSLNTLRMDERTGDYTMYSFMDKHFNVAIDSKLF